MAGLLRELPPSGDDSSTGRLFAIGDIHGCSRELKVLLEHLVTVEALTAQDQVIFIGDYVDRGEDSQGVVQQLVELKKHFPKTVFLRGNHEEMFLSFLGFEGENGEFWIQNGGGQTLQSYGLESHLSPESVRKHIPIAHLDFLRATELGVVTGAGIFVHAGLHPLKTLEEQTRDDLLWIRDEFIQNVHKFNKTVVFGHTPYWQVFLNLPYKVGIDTGCVYGNMLTAIEFTQQRLYQVQKVTGGEAAPAVKVLPIEQVVKEGGAE